METGTMKKFILIVVIVILVLMLPLLGGSMIWMLGGAKGLDINGTAQVYERPDTSIEMGEGWSFYGGDAGGHRFSNLSQINTNNVGNLSVAWLYQTGDLEGRPRAIEQSATEGTPLLVEGTLVFCTPFNEVIALNPGDGSEVWRFDPEINLEQDPANQFVCRGVAYWQDPVATGACSSRILMGTNDGRVIAIDAKNGDPCLAFGDNGEVQIDPGMELWWPGEFQITSPPVIAGNTVIVGSAIGDNARVEAPAGSVRAFDVRTGTAKWDFDPIPRTDSNPASASWKGQQPPREGHANVWAPMSVDHERGLVFLPTSSPSPDFYGGLRPGDNRHANSVVALRAETGELVWSFQTVHHDVWDYDLPAQPGLYTVWKDGQAHDVVAQVTKTGLVFVLDRDTGEPFLPIEERGVPQSAVEGERLSPTQPFPVLTPPLVSTNVTGDEAFGITWFDRRQCREQIEESLNEGLFTAPSEQGTLLYPFTGGGANWGSAAFDPTRNLLVVNMNNVAHHVSLFRSGELQTMRKVFHDQEVSPQEGAPFGMKRRILASSLDLPCTPPPWGFIAGVDLSTGKIVWRKTLGTTEDLAPGPGLKLGTPNLGGPVATAGGLVFIGAALDNYLRAFDISNGMELWKGRLPAGGQATPMTYEWEGRQYVVIYAGGYSRIGSKLGDYLVAYSLPK
jgi:quinoprotein glucose dehydrogenase